MPEYNGHDPIDPLREDLRLLFQSSAKNWEEHERIWQALESLRVNVLDMSNGMANLTSAIRALIDRIPPENLKSSD
jgi:hypothetical protein